MLQINANGNGDKIVTVFTVPKFSVRNLISKIDSSTGYYIINEDFYTGKLTKELFSKTTQVNRLYTQKQKAFNISISLFCF